MYDDVRYRARADSRKMKCCMHTAPIRIAAIVASFAVVLASRGALAQDAPPADPSAAPPPLPEPTAPPPSAPPSAPTVEMVAPPPPTPVPPPEDEEPPPRMSEGRMIVSAWNSGFQWGLAPGVIFVDGNARFALGVRLGYGFDTDSVIVVPGIRGSFNFTDPNVYSGMPMLKLVYPIDRFAPFVEGGAGIGHLTAGDTTPSATGAALFVGGGFMIHFTRSFALGAEVNYHTVTNTPFKAVGVGPIIALAF